MTRTGKREQSLLGLFFPHYRRYMIAFLEGWREVLCEPCKSQKIEEWNYLVFDFNNHKTQQIYRDLARAISYGWIEEENISMVARFMVTHSNMDDGKKEKTRIGTIRQGITRKMSEFKKIRQYRKQHGNIPITTQQGYLPANSNVGAGFGVNQNW